MTKADIYKALILRHKWTIDYIAELNPWQQILAADVDYKESSVQDLLEFATMEEYLRWKNMQG